LEEAFESEPEGFDAELIAQMQTRHRRQVATREGQAVVAPDQTGNSSRAGSRTPQPSEVWVCEAWPDDVDRILEQWNPNKWKFPR
jgi:hypothetical protein